MICQLRCVVYFRFPIYFLTIQTIMSRTYVSPACWWQKQVTELLQQYPGGCPDRCAWSMHNRRAQNRPYVRRAIQKTQHPCTTSSTRIHERRNCQTCQARHYWTFKFTLFKPSTFDCKTRQEKLSHGFFYTRVINNHTTPDCEPMPHMQTMFDDLAECKYMSHIDLTCGYFQINLHKDSRKYTAVVKYK